MAKPQSIETLLKSGSAEWNKLRKAGKVGTDHTGATFAQLFSANTDLSGLQLIGTEWEKCDLSKVSFRDTDLSNAYFHGGRLQDCDFRNANLEGATFEKLKLLRCDFTGARGLDDLEMDDVDMDRVVGLDGEEAPPPPPPPAHGVTSFTKEEREKSMRPAELMNANDLPPFRPQDPPGTLLFRGLKTLGQPPAWVLDVPGLRPSLPGRLIPGGGLEGAVRDAVKQRLEGRAVQADPEIAGRSQQALRVGSKDAAFGALYLRETGSEAQFRLSAARALRDSLRAELEHDDLTGSVDPRVAGALLELKLTHEAGDFLGEVKRRLAAAQLFSALLEAGFNPDNNWEEALDSSEPALELASVAVGDDRGALGEAFGAFAGLPEEARLRRLAYLAEASFNLEQLSRQPAAEPPWVSGPESRECHEKEMILVQWLKADEIPAKVAKLAQEELGIPEGSIPEDSDQDLFVHFRCAQCGKEKLIVQSPE